MKKNKIFSVVALFGLLSMGNNRLWATSGTVIKALPVHLTDIKADQKEGEHPVFEDIKSYNTNTDTKLDKKDKKLEELGIGLDPFLSDPYITELTTKELEKKDVPLKSDLEKAEKAHDAKSLEKDLDQKVHKKLVSDTLKRLPTYWSEFGKKIVAANKAYDQEHPNISRKYHRTETAWAILTDLFSFYRKQTFHDPKESIEEALLLQRLQASQILAWKYDIQDTIHLFRTKNPTKIQDVDFVAAFVLDHPKIKACIQKYPQETIKALSTEYKLKIIPKIDPIVAPEKAKNLMISESVTSHLETFKNVSTEYKSLQDFIENMQEEAHNQAEIHSQTQNNTSSGQSTSSNSSVEPQKSKLKSTLLKVGTFQVVMSAIEGGFTIFGAGISKAWDAGSKAWDARKEALKSKKAKEDIEKDEPKEKEDMADVQPDLEKVNPDVKQADPDVATQVKEVKPDVKQADPDIAPKVDVDPDLSVKPAAVSAEPVPVVGPQSVSKEGLKEQQEAQITADQEGMANTNQQNLNQANQTTAQVNDQKTEKQSQSNSVVQEQNNQESKVEENQEQVNKQQDQLNEENQSVTVEKNTGEKAGGEEESMLEFA